MKKFLFSLIVLGSSLLLQGCTVYEVNPYPPHSHYYREVVIYPSYYIPPRAVVIFPEEHYYHKHYPCYR